MLSQFTVLEHIASKGWCCPRCYGGEKLFINYWAYYMCWGHEAEYTIVKRGLCVLECIRCYNYKASVLPWGETVYAQQNGKKMWLESDFWWTCHIALEVKYNGEKKIAMDGEWHAMFIVQSLATPPGALVALNIKVPPERMLQKWLPFRILVLQYNINLSSLYRPLNTAVQKNHYTDLQFMLCWTKLAWPGNLAEPKHCYSALSAFGRLC